ncbi:MAG: hypothetical protein NDF54_09400 [archaeon GB-1867-035]|nr:hypothetical protein [Candidatus Culexmicrobium profundum]
MLDGLYPDPSEGLYILVEGFLLPNTDEPVDYGLIHPGSLVWQVELSGGTMDLVRITYYAWTGEGSPPDVYYYGEIYYGGSGPV